MLVKTLDKNATRLTWGEPIHHRPTNNKQTVSLCCQCTCSSNGEDDEQLFCTYSRMWAQQRHGDENFFDDYGPPQWCEYIEPLQDQIADELALQSLANQDGGWLW